MRIDLNSRVTFEKRHNGPGDDEIKAMNEVIGVETVDQLIHEAIPTAIINKEGLNLPEPLNEFEYLRALKDIASKNKIYTSFIGQGYYGTIVPAVIQRNILENPGWYTAYTPYQAEIAQGRLEALINYQTMVTDLTGMELSNASLLDEGTAAAEAMTMLYGLRKGAKKSAHKYLVDHEIFPQTLSVLETRAVPFGIEIERVDLANADVTAEDIFGIFFQYPNNNGKIYDWSNIVAAAKEHVVFVTCASDLLALTLIEAPGSWGTDVVIGTSQRFGVPMGYGGPHAAFFATRESYKRSIPGRIIGASKDAHGNNAYRMALQTREQHIKRERATSNICTAQVLLAVMSSMYAVYHGAEGLKQIASRTHGLAKLASQQLGKLGFKNENELFFDTLKVHLDTGQIEKLKELTEAKKVNFRLFEDGASISFDESHSPDNSVKISTIILTSSGL
jgi:glycine dehydrogenase